MKKVKILTNAYHKIIQTIGSKHAEAGGLLFGNPRDFVIRDFVYDVDAVTTATTYTFNAPFLNAKIDEKRKESLEPIGFIHSHPMGARYLSNPDKMYFKSQFKNFPELDYFIVPIVQSAVDGEYDFIPYIIYKDGQVELAELEILPNDYQSYIQRPPELLPPIPFEATWSLPWNMTFRNYYLMLWSTLLTGILVFSLCFLWLGFQYMYHQFKLSTLWILVE